MSDSEETTTAPAAVVPTAAAPVAQRESRPGGVGVHRLHLRRLGAEAARRDLDPPLVAAAVVE